MLPMQQVTSTTMYAEQWRNLLLRQPSQTPQTALSIKPGDRVLFVGAHPDDETFAAGATLSALAELGAHVHVVCLTSGEAAYQSDASVTTDLGTRRRGEFRDACAKLGVTSGVVLDFPDSDVSSHAEEATASIARVAERRLGEPSPHRLVAGSAPRP